MDQIIEGIKAGWVRRTAIALAVLPLFAGLGWSAGPGTTSADLLKIPLGSRAIGMGEAFTALADDSSAMYWNPAGLSLVSQKEATFMHSSLFESVHYEHAAFVMPGDSYAAGVNFSYLGYGDIAGYDNTGAATGDINAYSYVLNGGLSRLLTDSWALGVSGGLVHQTLDTNSANTFAANIGTLYMIPKHWLGANYRVGAAVQNLGPGLKFISEREPLPRRIKFGAAAMGIKQKPLNLTLDFTLPKDNDPYIGLGSEYWFKELIALRLGYAGSNDEGRGLRVGFGIKYGGILLDYAYAGFGDFGATNRINLSMRFGDKIRQLNTAERAILRDAKNSEKEGAYVQAVMAYDELLDRDPGNEHILHYMISAHDKMAESERDVNVAERSVPIPSPEDAAMAELVPDSPSYAKKTPSGTVYSPEAGEDPLGLNKLPEATALQAEVGVTKVPSVANFAASEAAAPATVAEGKGASKPSNVPALSPADIYGN